MAISVSGVRHEQGYLDAASTEPLHPAARDVLAAALDEGWADPGRLYGAARRARLLLDEARAGLAAAVGARPDEVRLTRSGTQALHAGVRGALAGRRRAGDLLVHSAVEHSAVLHAAATHHTAGGRTAQVGVDRTGRVDAEAFGAALAAPGVALACLQAANHEVGTLQPVAEVAAAAQRAGVPLLVDAAQVVGRTEVPAGWSVLAASAHKWGGPPGVGVLAVRKGVRWRSPWPEDDRGPDEPGFPDVPGALAAAAAVQARRAEAAALDTAHRALVDRLRREVAALVPDVEVVGHPELRLPHLVTFSCLYVDGEALLSALDREGFAVSSGSSCTASAVRPSHVLAAMGVLTHGNVRISLARTTTEAEVDRFLAVLPAVVARLRAEAGTDAL